MRKAAVILAAATLVAGCGGGEEKKGATSETVTQPPKRAGPRYVPSARHAHRPRGFVYNDEIGENVVTAPYDRVIELFGPPASRHGNCIEYKIVGRPTDHWKFCFKGQRMISAGG